MHSNYSSTQLAYPSPIDTHYIFEQAAPFLGQPGAGSPHHCPLDAPADQKVQECPKVGTLSDDDAIFGAGHIPPWIPLRALRDSYLECDADITEWFDFDNHECRVKPEVLLSLVRKFYPRNGDGIADYPPPVFPGTPEYYPYEYPSPQGPPHWCNEAFQAEGQWADWCPYVFEGEDMGLYRHPHIALASLEQYLASVAIPDKCGLEWDSEYPLTPDSSWDWVDMESDDPKSQPVVPYSWPENGAEATIKTVVSIGMSPQLFTVSDVAQVCELPDIVDIIGLAFPTFEVDTDGTKIEGSAGRWTPLYFTKRYNGLDHPVSS